MKSFVIPTTLALAVVMLHVSMADAQSPGRRFGARRPVTSPYLNLLRQQTPATLFQYYRRVRPEQQFRAADAQLNRSVTNLDRRVRRNEETARKAGIGPTGHSASFMQLGKYFSRGQSRN